ncbi:MAG: DUF6286 domain-containing protein [Acidimicrobiales bacterium]
MTLLRRFLALVLALALGATAVFVVVEAVGIRVGESPVLLPIDDWEQRLVSDDWSEWRADAWAIASGGTLALGVLLVILQLVPHRKPTVDRARGDGDRRVRFGRGGLNERWRDIIVDQDGVLGGKARVARRKAKVTARIPDGGDRRAALSSVRTALGEDLDRLRLAKRPKVRVEATETDDRVL